MKERPILFSGPMVRAQPNGTKTQTRRIVKPQPFCADVPGYNPIWGSGVVSAKDSDVCGKFAIHARFGSTDRWLACPYGKPGDRLWVRETYYQRGHWEPVVGVRTKKGRQKWAFIPADDMVVFDPPAQGFRKGMHKETPDYVIWHQRLGRFMPRKYSRRQLEITGIRCERLQDISEADAIAEGIDLHDAGEPRDGLRWWKNYEFKTAHPAAGLVERLKHVVMAFNDPRSSYRSLWDFINGPGSWDLNPWVWVVEFRVVKPDRAMGRLGAADHGRAAEGGEWRMGPDN